MISKGKLEIRLNVNHVTNASPSSIANHFLQRAFKPRLKNTVLFRIINSMGKILIPENILAING